jgi:hypothetical protein
VNTKTASITQHIKFGTTTAKLHSLYAKDDTGGRSSLAIQFDADGGIGLSVSLHGSTQDARKLATEILLHCADAEARAAGVL